MKDLFDRVRGDLDFTKLIRFLEELHETENARQSYLASVYAKEIRDLRDRLVRGVPVAGSDLDVESFLAADFLTIINLAHRQHFKPPFGSP